MTAKELRQAAEYTVTMWDNHDSKRLVAGDELFFNSDGEPDSVTFARHILSTVRDDDDEPADRRWQGEAMMRSSANFGMCQTVYAIWDQVSKSGGQSRGQFRSLCRGLGIELKEKE